MTSRVRVRKSGVSPNMVGIGNEIVTEEPQNRKFEKNDLGFMVVGASR